MVRVGLFSGMVERTAYVGIMLIQVSILAIGAYMVSRGRMTVGSLASFQAVFLSLSYSMANVTQYAPALVEAAGSIRRIEELLAQEPMVKDTGTEPVPDFSEIRFNDVDFGYARPHRNLNALNVSISRRQFVAVVGPSGSGKSTLLTLLLRLYDPDQGSVSIDNIDIRHFPLRSLRMLFGYVPQESFLFDISIRENIRLGKPGATDEEVEAAARSAEIHDFILQLPKGYATLVGERGGRLSGGQRQRIALARAIIRNPAVLILDEATSALDAATETAIQATLGRLRKDWTILSVTHRLATVVDADRILVLEQGHLIQDGTHRELVGRNGLYRELWERQHGFVLDKATHQAEISMERLRLVPVFYGMPDSLLAEATGFFHTEEFPEGHVVIREGEISACLYILVRGSVELTRIDGKGGSRVVTVLRDGDCFGERALLEDLPEMDSVRALCDSVCLTLNRAAFLHLSELAVESSGSLFPAIDDRPRK
jgi:ATP-binding cassette subfamily B protein